MTNNNTQPRLHSTINQVNPWKKQMDNSSASKHRQQSACNQPNTKKTAKGNKTTIFNTLQIPCLKIINASQNYQKRNIYFFPQKLIC